MEFSGADAREHIVTSETTMYTHGSKHDLSDKMEGKLSAVVPHRISMHKEMPGKIMGTP